MRWYAVAPTLPEKAVLRIRSAPSSDADVCGSIAKGRVIAALSPEFEIDQPDGSSDPPQRWLHVTFQDEDSGEDVQGYVMAAFPDGVRRLLVPWEDAGANERCFVPAQWKESSGRLTTSHDQ
ncbi:hypothetical protein PINS_up003028 [Pythium insidiosum]|nr:hypothetical protein PINS_up003028 [Pythium insidiosum]